MRRRRLGRQGGSWTWYQQCLAYESEKFCCTRKRLSFLKQNTVHRYKLRRAALFPTASTAAMISSVVEVAASRCGELSIMTVAVWLSRSTSTEATPSTVAIERCGAPLFKHWRPNGDAAQRAVGKPGLWRTPCLNRKLKCAATHLGPPDADLAGHSNDIKHASLGLSVLHRRG